MVNFPEEELKVISKEIQVNSVKVSDWIIESMKGVDKYYINQVVEFKEGLKERLDTSLSIDKNRKMIFEFTQAVSEIISWPIDFCGYEEEFGISFNKTKLNGYKELLETSGEKLSVVKKNYLEEKAKDYLAGED